jgi:hypothetical protein
MAVKPRNKTIVDLIKSKRKSGPHGKPYKATRVNNKIKINKGEEDKQS